MNKKTQKKSGIMISYINTALNMFISVFFTPFLIASLGQAEYGLYRTIHSFAGTLSIMTFGMNAVVTRNIAFYNAKNQYKEKENFLAMAVMISVILSILALILGWVLYNISSYIFCKSFSQSELLTAKKLILLLVINISIIILNDCFIGIINGYEKFAISNGIRTISLLLRIIVLIILLKLGFKSVAIVATDVALSILALIFIPFINWLKKTKLIRQYLKVLCYFLRLCYCKP